MKYLLTVYFCVAILNLYATKEMSFAYSFSYMAISEINMTETDSLPLVFTKNHADIIESRLKNEAYLRFMQLNLPDTKDEWEIFKPQLRNKIIEKAGVIFDHKLPLDYHETGSINMEGYKIKNIYFQTLPGVYATANLYIPDGTGPFPAVINMHGHWLEARLANPVQSVAQSLVLNGYVCLSLDAFGAGERSTVHGIFEDHGDENNLGSSLMNIGKPLMGIEISENIRGVDLLCSLPYVDSKNIGATGASGGGNQTMWLASMDERIKASMPVVSAGTFESFIMGSPCICEVLPCALNFTEEAGILAMVAPRAIKMCNHNKDENSAFYPVEMLRSYKNAKTIFKMFGVENNITYQLFDLIHGYMTEDREAMLGWFDLYLKGIGSGVARKEIPFKLLPEEKLMVFAKGQRDPKVISTDEYCRQKGNALRNVLLNTKSFDTELKRNELRKILGVEVKSTLKNVHEYSKIRGWDRFALETFDNKLIPVLLRSPSGNSKEFVIVTNPDGKNSISSDLVDGLIKSGRGIAIFDLSGTGESTSNSALLNYGKERLRTISRSELWFGRTIIGEWVKEIDLVTQFVESRYEAKIMSFDSGRESGVAALCFAVLHGEKVRSISLREAPVSYLFDNREGINFFSMAIFLPGFLEWGDVSLAAALSGKNIQFINPVSMSGSHVSGEKLKAVEDEFKQIRIISRNSGNTNFY